MSRARRLAAALALTGALFALTACASSADPIDPIERLGRKAAEKVSPRVPHQPHPPRAVRGPSAAPSGSAVPVRPLARNRGLRPRVLPGVPPRHATGS
ncbi:MULTISPECIES: hypothetical protein [unclassified Streptomyces]|uniref:hypothetical protein n=1 Tax=unclassified Streptomyces TaxID=2593676 RepID=UPI002E33EAE9|nr:hypothetical protein [Streptomyces sp. NBC_01268]